MSDDSGTAVEVQRQSGNTSGDRRDGGMRSMSMRGVSTCGDTCDGTRGGMTGSMSGVGNSTRRITMRGKGRERQREGRESRAMFLI